MGPSPTALGPPWVGAVALWGRRLLLHLGVTAALGVLLLWVSIFLYGSFYFAFLPAHSLVRAAHFTFRTDCEVPAPQVCSFPTANVSLVGSNKERLLHYGTRYRVALELEVPESPPNRALGMFLVSVTFYGAGERPITTAARAAMLHYRSPLLRALETLVFSGFFLSGLGEQKQILEIELEGGYSEDPYTPTLGALLRLHSRGLQLYGARLRMAAAGGGLRFLLFHFPLLSAFLGISGNFALLSLGVLGGYLRWGRGGHTTPPTAPPGPPQVPPQETSGPPQETPEGDEPPPEGPEMVGPGEPQGDAASPPPAEEETEPEAEPEGPRGVPVSPPNSSPRPRPACSSS